MAKELDKLTKEFAPLKKSARALVDGMAPIGTNYGHFLSMGGEMKDEVTRRVGELRKAGAIGTKLSDFAGDKDIKAVVAEVDNMKKQMAALVKRSDAALAEGKVLNGQLEKMAQDLDKSIAERKKKKDRAVFAVDSASLPELEKLSKDIHACRKELYDEVVALLTTTPYLYDPKSTDALLDKAVGASASVRAEMDEKALAQRGLDLRLLSKNLQLSAKHADTVKAQLSEAIKLAKASDSDGAHDRLAEATTARSALQKIAEQYALAMKGMNRYDLEGMKQSSDGKKVLAATGKIAELDTTSGKLLEAVLKTMPS